MSLVRIIGLNSYTLVETRTRYTTDSGQNTILTYEGDLANIDTLFDSLKLEVQVGDGQSVSKSRRDGKGVIQVEYADSNGTQEIIGTPDDDKWEVIPQDLTKNIRAYGGDISGTQAFNVDGDQAALEVARQYYLSAGQAGSLPTVDPAETYYKILLTGQTEYVRSAAILRRSRTVGSRSPLIAVWKNVDRAVKLSETGIPSIGQAALIGSINEMPEADSGKKQWLTRSPGIQDAGRQKYRISQEWWYAKEWSSTFYDGDAAV